MLGAANATQANRVLVRTELVQNVISVGTEPPTTLSLIPAAFVQADDTPTKTVRLRVFRVCRASTSTLIEPTVESVPLHGIKMKLPSQVVNLVLSGGHQTSLGARHAFPASLENLNTKMQTTKLFVLIVGLGSTLTAPMRQSAKRALLESIKMTWGKRLVFPACLESTGEQIQQTAAIATPAKPVQHPLIRVAKRRANNRVQEPLFSEVVQRQSKFQTVRT